MVVPRYPRTFVPMVFFFVIVWLMVIQSATAAVNADDIMDDDTVDYYPDEFDPMDVYVLMMILFEVGHTGWANLTEAFIRAVSADFDDDNNGEGWVRSVDLISDRPFIAPSALCLLPQLTYILLKKCVGLSPTMGALPSLREICVVGAYTFMALPRSLYLPNLRIVRIHNAVTIELLQILNSFVSPLLEFVEFHSLPLLQSRMVHIILEACRIAAAHPGVFPAPLSLPRTLREVKMWNCYVVDPPPPPGSPVEVRTYTFNN